MDVFPAFYPLAGRRVGLAGEGEGLQARRRLLSGSPAELVILDAAAAVSPDAWAGMALGFIAHPDEAFSRQAADAARRAGAPVNVMDRPALCDFTVPALIDRGALVAAFGTGGASPLIAARLRAEMESRVPEGLGRLARFLEDNKAALRGRYPDPGERRVFLSGLLEGPVAVAVLEGRPDADVQALLAEALSDAARPRGRLFTAPSETPPDLLSLRALRVLSATDVLVIRPGEAEGVANMARREARRLSPEAADPDEIAALLAEGRTVVLLTDPAPWRAAGLEPEDLPVAPGFVAGQ
ncbi:NAD(P)-dependent oxidoreductase [Phenylobacterium sp.]|uniref:siroheme synthase n=1 Tax=Phenylobacterium sp. TaxID=1871053 RepID=UPI0025D0CD2B|nr:NAD(P)-dependent oxidoreductase [Phenylobacterium sp.]MCA6285146.1 siroheme synthase [Phenylobacterium sp.]MCA6289812.1 siroheme synthase [Phenylobacterium sp.]MCA6309179.1 siroheme synthase [Phenylobacterium sp.]MCA6322833.1 siroheme synthase [Phenylobacterium sp.]MCA6336740.1 siroheme synthase [Phenylobacterium sp.]